MINNNSRTPDNPTSAPVTRLLDLLVSTAQNQRLALDLLQRYWKTTATPAMAPQPQPARKTRAEAASQNSPVRRIPTAEIGTQVVRALQALAASGRLRVNEPSGDLYVDREHVAVVVPYALRAVRSYLKAEGWTLPDRIYDELRAQGIVLVGDTGRLVRRLDLRVGTVWRATDVRALLVPRALLEGLAAHAGFDEVTLTERPPVVSTTVNSAPADEPVALSPTVEEPVNAAPQHDLYGYEAGYAARRHD